MSIPIINKITVRSVVGDKTLIRKVAEEANGAAVSVMRAMGIARSYETGEGDNGPWVRFKGSFSGINILTGEEFRSGKLFLPGVASDLVEAQLMEEDVSSVELAFDINAVADAKSAVGYVYTATPLVELGENDPILALASSLPKLPSQEKLEKQKDAEKKSTATA